MPLYAASADEQLRDKKSLDRQSCLRYGAGYRWAEGAGGEEDAAVWFEGVRIAQD